MHFRTMTMKQYAADLTGKSCMIANFYGKDTSNDAFIEGINVSARHIIRQYWTHNAQANMTNMAIQAESLWLAQKNACVATTSVHLNLKKDEHSMNYHGPSKSLKFLDLQMLNAHHPTSYDVDRSHRRCFTFTHQ